MFHVPFESKLLAIPALLLLCSCGERSANEAHGERPGAPANTGVPANTGAPAHREAGALPPRRIVPASATAVDLVTALVAPERVAGFPVQALEYSTLHGSSDGLGAFAQHPRFEAWLAEPVLMLQPDLVVVDPWQAVDTNARLAEAGVRVHRLGEVANLEDALAQLERLAAVLGAEARAAELSAELERRVARLAERTAARPPRAGSRGPISAMCYSNFGAAGWSAGGNTTIDEVMRLAGCINLLATTGREGHVQVDFEELLVLDPEVIVVSLPLAMGTGPAGDRGGASEKLLRTEPALAGLRAVRGERIARLPAWLYATGSHELVTAAEALADELDRLSAGERGE